MTRPHLLYNALNDPNIPTRRIKILITPLHLNAGQQVCAPSAGLSFKSLVAWSSAALIPSSIIIFSTMFDDIDLRWDAMQRGADTNQFYGSPARDRKPCSGTNKQTLGKPWEYGLDFVL